MMVFMMILVAASGCGGGAAEDQPSSSAADTKTEKTAEKDIGADRVRQIVLGRVPGATSSNITEFERDIEDGHIEYEGTIVYGGVEYEFTIDGATGNILEWEKD